MVERKSKKKDSKKEDTHVEFATKGDLKSFLMNIRDKMTEGVAAPVYAVSAINHILSTPGVDDLLNKENKEIARDIWLRIKQSGFQLRNPILLFSPEEELPGNS